MNKCLKKFLKILSLSLLFLICVFLIWALNPLQPDNSVSLKSTENVKIDESGGYITLKPILSNTNKGFIFYPGGHVDYRAYVPIITKIAEIGYFCVIVKMPLSLAIFGINKASRVITQYPEIDKWVIGGHSLGGSMAASWTKKNHDKVIGLVLWASYPSSNTDLSMYNDLKTIMIYGTNNKPQELDINKFNLNLLPSNNILEIIEGANHAQFGNYGIQSGDGTATITIKDQQEIIIEQTIIFFNNILTS